MIMGFKGIDKHLIYAQVAFFIVAVFILLYSIVHIAIIIDTPKNLSLNTWHADGPVLNFYEKGILTKDSGTTYTFQTTFRLDQMFSISNPTLFIKEGIIPSQVFINGKPLSITNIAKGHHEYTYNISYTLPPSSLSYENTITIVYTTGNKAGWLSQAYIVSSSYANRYIFLHSMLQFIGSKSIAIVSLIAFIALSLLFIYSRYRYIALLAEASFLIFLISTLSVSATEEISLTYFLPIAIGVLILQQATHNIKSYPILFIEVVVVTIALTLPIFINHHQYSYALIRFLLALPPSTITILDTRKIPSNSLPVTYWLIVLFGTILGESFIQIMTGSKQVYTAASLLTTTSSTIIFALFGLYTETLFVHREHPISYIYSLIDKQQLFASIFIRSFSLVRDIKAIRALIVPELYGKDTYTITDKGVWIIRPDITENEVIIWSGKMIEKLRDEKGIKDIRIGILMVDPSLNESIHVRKLMKETIELSETAHYPEFINIKSHQ